MGLTVTNVLNAYEKSGLKPVTGRWCPNKKCGCGMTALYCSQHKAHPLDTSDDADWLIGCWANKRYGEDCVSGFITGFDDIAEKDVPDNFKKESFRRGYWLARKAYKALKQKYKKIKSY